MKALIKSIAPIGFFRCGAFFPPEGRVVAATEFTKEQWQILENEPNLHIGPAADDAEEALADLAAQVRGAIGALPVDGFGDDGVPKVEAIRAALPEVKSGITKKLVAEVWADLKPAA